MITEVELHRQFKEETGISVQNAKKRQYIEWLEQTVLKMQNEKVDDMFVLQKANELFCDEIQNRKESE